MIRLLAVVLSIVAAVPSAAAPSSEGSSPRAHTFTIVQLNDIYELFPVPEEVGDHIEPRGGLVYAATVVEEARKKGPVLVLHAGDFISPSLLSIKLKHRGAQIVEAMNLLRPGLVTFGNHEFDFGCKTLGERIQQSTFTWLSSNVVLPKEMGVPEGRVKPWTVVSIAGLRVGLFGLTIPGTPVPGCGESSITFREPVEAAREAVAALEKERVDLVVGLTHLNMFEDRQLAEALPRIDLIVGGHEHEVMESVVGRTLITKAAANATRVGVIELTAVKAGRWVVEKSWTTREVDPARVPADPRLAEATAAYAKEMEPFKAIIGETLVPLEGQEIVIREQETNLGNFVADVVRAEGAADVAILNGGGFRADRVIPPGSVTAGDMASMLPFDNTIVVVNIKGSELRAALENGVSLVGQRGGRFPQVSGLRFVFDPKRPVGSRVVEVEVGGALLDAEHVYTLATTEFLLKPGGIDNYAFPQDVVRRAGDMNQAVERALKKGPIRPLVEGRITVRTGE